eukprot:scaffold13460_cov116-Isochrysis_galbana.AAC.3
MRANNDGTRYHTLGHAVPVAECAYHANQHDRLEDWLRGVERGAPVEDGPHEPREQDREERRGEAPDQAHKPIAQVVRLDARLKPALLAAVHLVQPAINQLRQHCRHVHHLAQRFGHYRLGCSHPLGELDGRAGQGAVGAVVRPAHQQRSRGGERIAAGGEARSQEERLVWEPNGWRARGDGEARRQEQQARIDGRGDRGEREEGALGAGHGDQPDGKGGGGDEGDR